MFVGHAALALLAKAKRPSIPIALLVPVAFAPDWVELVADVFHHDNRQISHSLVSVGIGATVVAALFVILSNAVILREPVILSEAPALMRSVGKDRFPERAILRSLRSLRMTPQTLRMTMLSDALALWLMYASHWPADFITGNKPTWPGGPNVGLMLYANPLADIVLECALTVACWMVYTRSLPEASRKRAINLLIPLGLIGMQIVFEAFQSPDFGPDFG